MRKIHSVRRFVLLGALTLLGLGIGVLLFLKETEKDGSGGTVLNSKPQDDGVHASPEPEASEIERRELVAEVDQIDESADFEGLFEGLAGLRNGILGDAISRKMGEAEAEAKVEVEDWVMALGLSSEQVDQLMVYYLNKLENKELHMRLAFGAPGTSWSEVKTALKENTNRQVHLGKFMESLLDDRQLKIFRVLNSERNEERRRDSVERKVARLVGGYGLGEKQERELAVLYRSDAYRQKMKEVDSLDHSDLSPSDRYVERKMIKMQRELDAVAGILDVEQYNGYAKAMELELERLDAMLSE